MSEDSSKNYYTSATHQQVQRSTTLNRRYVRRPDILVKQSRGAEMGQGEMNNSEVVETASGKRYSRAEAMAVSSFAKCQAENLRRRQELAEKINRERLAAMKQKRLQQECEAERAQEEAEIRVSSMDSTEVLLEEGAKAAKQPEASIDESRAEAKSEVIKQDEMAGRTMEREQSRAERMMRAEETAESEQMAEEQRADTQEREKLEAEISRIRAEIMQLGSSKFQAAEPGKKEAEKAETEQARSQKAQVMKPKMVARPVVARPARMGVATRAMEMQKPRQAARIVAKAPAMQVKRPVDTLQEASRREAVRRMAASASTMRQAQAPKASVARATRQPSAQELKDEAIRKAMRSMATAEAKEKKARKERKGRKEEKQATKEAMRGGHKARVVLAIVSAIAVVAGIGYFVSVNLPDVSMKVAAIQTGIENPYPSYIPRGFSLATSSSGQDSVSMVFTDGDKSFSLTEEKSTWDSKALYSNFVELKWDNVDTVKEQGLTIYIAGSNAAWVNGGVKYTIEAANGVLTNKQIKNIATSL